MILEVDIDLRRGDFSLRLSQQFDAPVTGIFGASGCGKSTLLRVIAGLITPQSGHVVMEGQVFLDTARKINLAPEQRHVGLMFQDAQLFPHLSVQQNLNYGFKRRHPAQRRFQHDDIVALLDLGHLLHRLPHHLSGGEKQRVALGRALLYSPQLLLLDEPLSSLDDLRKAQILPFLQRVRDEIGIPMLYVSHSMSEIQMLTDTVIHL
jgi:molybdate transport system ATP-binding protein